MEEQEKPKEPENPDKLKWLQDAIDENIVNFFKYSEFSIGRKISDSGTISIFESEWVDFGMTVALKSLKVEIDGNDINSFVKELQLFQRVNFHPKINHFFGVTLDPYGSYMMVLQYANDGDLRGYLDKNFSKLKWEDKLHIAGEIAQGLVFLHNNNIIHRNLHTKNILVHDNKMMITDFVSSKLINSESSSSSNSTVDGMPSFIDPQCFKNPTYKRDTKSDIYSYGVILWEISSGHKPFPLLKRIQIAIKIYNGERETPIEGTQPEYVDLYKRCWDDEPNNRPKIEEIIEFFNPYIIKPTETHVNIEKSSGKLLEEAISKKTITSYNYGEFNDHIMVAEEEFSTVYKSSWKPRGSIVALKHLKVHNKYLDKKIVKELQFLQNAVHPNIIKFYGITNDPSSKRYIMVMQFIGGGNLSDYLKKNFSELQWTRQLCIAIEIAEGLEYLHKNEIAHLDLNPKNILVCEEKMVIAGFGIPEDANRASFTTSITRGVPAYIEPRCLNDPQYKRDMRSDIYSLGVILWEISSGRPPFSSLGVGFAVTIQVFNGKRETPVEGSNPDYVKLYKLCWDEDPAKRPDIKSVPETLKKLRKESIGI